MNLVQMLAASVEKHAARPVIHVGEKTLSYDDLGRQVEGLRRSLENLGLGHGDRVALMLPNTPQFVVSYFAVLNCGAVVVPLNAKLKPQEVQYILNDVGAKVVITFADVAAGLETIFDHVPTEHMLVIDGEHPTMPASFAATCESADAFVLNEKVTPDDHAVYLYTSGTTGKPKGVILTHGNFYANLEAVAAVFDFHRDDRFMTVLPLYHSFGHSICMLLPVMVGASFVPLPKFSPTQVLSELQRVKATIFAAVPTMYAMLAQHPEGSSFDLSTIRYSFSGGAALPGQVMKDFEETYGVTIIEGYGHTEASPVVFVNPSPAKRKVGSVGVPIPTVEVKLIGEDGKETQPPGQGELHVRGPSIMKGYYNLPEVTEEVLHDGWLEMRDLFRVDEDGYFYLIDRLIDLIIVGGANVYPREVEEVLYQHRSVAEAAVIGVDDEVYGETVKAVVALKANEEASEGQLIEHCAGLLAKFKVPKRIEFREELPKTSSGKISKKELR